MIDIEHELANLAEVPPAHLERVTVLAVDAGDQVAMKSSVHGPLWISWSKRGITGLTPTFVDETVDAFIEHHRRAGYDVETLPSALDHDIETALASGVAEGLSFDLRGLSSFQVSVLEACQTIPCGSAQSYGWIAGQLGKPGATRAVGTALAKNPIPLLIPCHRVVRSDGSVGSYAFGSDMKRELLVEEGVLLPGM